MGGKKATGIAFCFPAALILSFLIQLALGIKVIPQDIQDI